MPTQERFTLRSETIGCLPIVNRFLERMGLSKRLDRYLPRDDARLRLAPAAVIGVVVRNIVVRHRPVYALSEWVTPYDPAVLGLEDGDAAALNDDRIVSFQPDNCSVTILESDNGKLRLVERGHEAQTQVL